LGYDDVVPNEDLVAATGSDGSATGSDGSNVGSAGASGGGGTGGAPGTGGVPDAGSAGPDTGSPGICDYAAPFSLLYRDYPQVDGFIDFGLKLLNGSAGTVALSEFKIRYFLTNEISAPMVPVLYGDVCCPDVDILTHVSATVVPMSQVAPKADTYIEIGFDASTGNLAPGQTVEVEVHFQNAINTPSNKTNDYSYISTALGSQGQWSNCPTSGNCAAFHSCVMTVHRNNVLVWGYPP
jgi:hypothetical protein